MDPTMVCEYPINEACDDSLLGYVYCEVRRTLPLLYFAQLSLFFFVARPKLFVSDEINNVGAFSIFHDKYTTIIGNMRHQNTN